MRCPPIIIVIAVIALLGLTACGDDDNESDKKAATADTGNVARYCTLTRELDAAGEKFFAKLEREDASPKEFEAAERRFIEQSAGKIKETEQVAPQDIKADVRKLLAGMRQRAGLETTIEVDESEASAAEQRLRAYEKRNCGA